MGTKHDLNLSWLQEIIRLAHLAAPLIIAQLGQVAMVFVDTVMMGMLGTQALAGGGLGATIFSFLYMICVGMISVVGNLVAHAYGSGDKTTVSNVVRAGFIVSTGLAVLCGLLLWNSPFWLPLLGQNDSNAALGSSFLRAVLWSIAPGLWFMTLKGLAVGLLQPRSISIIVVSASFLNILLNYIFIYGWLGLPALGLAGIGLSTSFVFLLMFLALMARVIQQPVFWSYRIFTRWSKIKLHPLYEVIRLGIPIGVTYGVESALFMVAALLMGILGTTQLAAYQIAERTVYLVYMFPVGIYQAVSILVGQAFGKQDIHQVRLLGRLGLLLGGFCECVAALLFWLIPEQIVGLYLQKDTAENIVTASQAMQFLGIAAIFLIFDGSQIIMSGAIQGLKDSKSTMMISVIGYWVIGLPIAYLLGFHTELAGEGIWWGLSAGLASGAILMTFYFEIKTKLLLNKIGE